MIPLQARSWPRGWAEVYLYSSMTAALEGVSGQQHAQAAFTPGKDPVPILQEAGWAPGPVWMGGKSRPHRDSILDRPARSSIALPAELQGPQLAGTNVKPPEDDIEMSKHVGVSII